MKAKRVNIGVKQLAIQPIDTALKIEWWKTTRGAKINLSLLEKINIKRRELNL